MNRWEQYVGVAAEALNGAVCICKTGRNQHGGWYVADPTCPKCGDGAAKARVVLEAVGPLIELATYLKVVEWIDETEKEKAVA